MVLCKPGTFCCFPHESFVCSQTPDGKARHQAKATGRSKKEARNASAKVGRGKEGGGVGPGWGNGLVKGGSMGRRVPEYF